MRSTRLSKVSSTLHLKQYQYWSEWGKIAKILAKQKLELTETYRGVLCSLETDGSLPGVYFVHVKQTDTCRGVLCSRETDGYRPGCTLFT